MPMNILRPGKNRVGESMTNALLDIWQQGKASLNGWLHLPLPYTAESMAKLDFDSVTCDMQHGMIDYSNLVVMLSAMAGNNTVPLVRVPGLDKTTIGRVLDAGALGIICPMISDAQQAEELVSACRYAPVGERSFGPNRASFYGAEYVKWANDSIIPFAMLEDQQALDNLDEILGTEGLKAVYVGPVDLSLSLGAEPKIDPTDPVVIEAIDLIAAKTKEYGVVAGIHTGSVAGANRMISKGYQFVSLPSERILLEMAVKQIVNEFRSKDKVLEAGY